MSKYALLMTKMGGDNMSYECLYFPLKQEKGPDLSVVTATAGDVDEGKIFVNSSGQEVEGISTYKADYTALNTLVGQTTATAEDVAQGKLFVNSSGVQTTGTASSGNEDFIKMIQRPENTTITIPSGLTFIGNYAFSSFSTLIDINIPNTITSIGSNSFSGCQNLDIPSLPSTITSLGAGAFYYCSELKWTSLPSGITSIPASAFAYCSKLALTSLPSGVTDIGDRAFFNANNNGNGLNISQIPASVNTIGKYAFNGCYLHGTLTFLGTPSTIDVTAFVYNSNLTTINVPWSSGAVAGAPWGATNATIVYDYVPTP